MLGCIQPMSSPMMKRMLGLLGVCARIGVAEASAAAAKDVYQRIRRRIGGSWSFEVHRSTAIANRMNMGDFRPSHRHDHSTLVARNCGPHRCNGCEADCGVAAPRL